MPIETNHFPITERSHFFRYLTAGGAIATLEAKSWRLTSPGNLNDPEDLIFKKILPYTADELRHASNESVSRALVAGRLPPLIVRSGKLPPDFQLGESPLTFEQWMRELDSDPTFIAEYRTTYERLTDSINADLQQAFTDHFLLCLTKDAVDAQMWETYGDGNRGAVFRIDCLADEDNVVRAAQPVRYSDDPPSYGSKDEWLDLLEGGPGISVERLYKDIVTWKRTKWAYEKEWRVIYIDKNGAGEKHAAIKLRPRELSEIYLGSKMDPAHKRQIEELVRISFPHTLVIST